MTPSDSASAIVKYVKVRADKVPPEEPMKFIDTQFQQLVQHIRMSNAITHDEAMHVISIVSHHESPFTHEHVDQLGHVTDELLNTTSATSGPQGASHCQEHSYIHHYLGASTWATLRSEMSISHKVEHLARVLCDTCYLRNPDEITRRAMVALVYRASDKEVEPGAALVHVQQLRDTMKAIRALNHGPRGPKTYPADPVAFHTMYPSSPILTHDPPVDGGIDEISLTITQKQVPVRKSHRHAPKDHVPVAPAPKEAGSDRLAELTKYIVGTGVASGIANMSAAPHWLCSTPTKESEHTSPMHHLKREHSPPVPKTESWDGSSLHAEPTAAGDVLPHASQSIPGDSLHGSLDDLRNLVDSRFTSANTPPHASASSCDIVSPKFRMRSKGPVVAMRTPSHAPAAMKRPAGSMDDSLPNGWSKHEYIRRTSGKPYHIYVAPNGQRFPSLKKAEAAGLIAS